LIDRKFHELVVDKGLRSERFTVAYGKNEWICENQNKVLEKGGEYGKILVRLRKKDKRSEQAN
jgi:hypothetical protein